MMDLYPFQKEGVGLGMQFFSTGQHGIIIGDEPGLGKTVQGIRLAQELKAVNVLVVCPSKLKLNWVAEFGMWAPGEYLATCCWGRTDSPKTHPLPQVTIVNYDLLKDLDWSQCDYDLIIYDEAHRLRNPESQWTIAAAKIRTQRRIMLTGTPFVNRPREVWQLLLFCGLVHPAQFHDFGLMFCQARKEMEFRSRGSKKKGTFKTIREEKWIYDGAANLEELNRRLYSMCMIRRMKRDVLPDLPPKTRRLIELKELFEPCEDVMNTLQDLKGLLRTTSYAASVKQLEDSVQMAFEEIALIRHETALEKVAPSLSYIKDALEESEKIVVFAYHRDVIAELKEGLAAYGALDIVGGMDSDEAQANVARFQNDPSCRIIIGQIQAAGEGLTLTAASRVIFVELDWTPAGMQQCEDRCHRIGQKDNVLVEHLVFSGTIDAKIAKTLIKKQKIFEAAIDKSIPPTVDWLTELTN